jgi:hypothetical protein
VRLRHWLGILAVGLTIVTTARAARAEEPARDEDKPRQPVAVAERRLTLPRLTLAPELSVDVSRLSGEGIGEGEIEVGAAVGARFGILDDLEIGATVAPIVVTPEFAYGSPRLWSTYRFLEGEVEVGASFSIGIITYAAPLSLPPLPFQETGVLLQPGMPVRIHIGETARLDVGVYVPIELGGLGALGMKIPVEFVYDFVKAVHVAVSTGFVISNLNDAVSHMVVPAGLSTGFALAGKKGPVLDIDPFFRFPLLFTPGLEPGHQLHVDAFVAGLEASYFLYL